MHRSRAALNAFWHAEQPTRRRAMTVIADQGEKTEAGETLGIRSQVHRMWGAVAPA